MTETPQTPETEPQADNDLTAEVERIAHERDALQKQLDDLQAIQNEELENLREEVAQLKLQNGALTFQVRSAEKRADAAAAAPKPVGEFEALKMTLQQVQAERDALLNQQRAIETAPRGDGLSRIEVKVIELADSSRLEALRNDGWNVVHYQFENADLRAVLERVVNQPQQPEKPAAVERDQPQPKQTLLPPEPAPIGVRVGPIGQIIRQGGINAYNEYMAERLLDAMTLPDGYEMPAYPLLPPLEVHHDD